MGNSDAKLLLIGLDNSGKTTILSRITNPDEQANITPTIGYRKDKFSSKGIDFQVLDMSGQSKYRDLWQSNAINHAQKDLIHGIIFVVDSTDKMRLKVAKQQLSMIIQNKNIPQYIPFLFYANKIDQKGHVAIDEITDIMDLKNINRHYRIFPCSGLNGKGIQEGIDWLSGVIKIKLENK